VIAESAVNRIVLSNANAVGYVVGQTISVHTATWNTSIFYGRQITAINTYDASNKSIVFDGAPVNIAIGNILTNTGQKNGSTDAVVAKSGSPVSNSDGKRPCKYRGIESPWGDTWQWMDGININEFQSWVCKDANSYASNLFANPYEQLGYVNKNANGYVKTRGFDESNPYIEIATDVTAGLATFYTDFYFQALGQRISLVGGDLRNSSYVGLFFLSTSDTSSFSHYTISGRLTRKAI
jgi:hypothetical protein